MSKKIIFIFLVSLLWTTNLFSQDENLRELTIEELFFSFRQPTAEMIKFVDGLENKRILNFDKEQLERYPDTLKNPEKIKFVSIGYYSSEELENNIDTLQNFPNLEYLEIKTAVQFGKSETKDTLVLPEILKSLPNLRYLQLSGSYQIDYENLFFKLQQLPALEYLGMPYVMGNVELPLNFLEMKNLKGIKISGFKKFIFPKNMGSMDNLESIVMPVEPYENFPEVLTKFSTLPALKHLALEYVKFDKEALIPFRKLTKLEKLYFSIFEIDNAQDLVESISRGNKLKELTMQNLKTNKGISDYTKLKNLEKLHISSYSGYSIRLPESIYGLKNLKYLTIHTDSLFSVSGKVGNLKNLEELNLSYNKITSLPSEIGELKKLRYLDLTNNNISILPSNISELTALETLNLGANSIKELPGNFGNLSSLNSLSLSDNKIAELPPDFANLSKLHFLNLNINYLQLLPENFGDLRALRKLNLEDNFLRHLPTSFSDLDNLNYLQLGFNNLQELPMDFGNLKALEELFLGGNQNNLKPHVYQENTGYVMDEKRPVRLFNEIKVLPHSFSRLKNLEMIYLRQMSTLDEKALFEVLFQIPSKKYHLDISNTSISYLPQKGWENFLGESLNMGGNVLKSIPSNIVKAPYLSNFIFKLSKEDGLSYNLRGKAELKAFFEEKGFIEFSALPRTRELAKAYLDNANNREYTAGNNILELINKAFLIDSSYTQNNIRASVYADALLRAGDFQKAIKYYDRAIARDTAQGPYILNFIIPNFENRSIAQMAVGDTLTAIKGLAHVSQRFSSGDWAEAALLARAIGKDSLAATYFINGEKFYKNYIQSNLDADRVDYGYQLSLLELYIVQEDLQKASDYLNQLKGESIIEKDKQLLLEYLGQIVAILQKNLDRNDFNNFLSKIKGENFKISSWSFELVEKWLAFTKIDTRKADMIRILTETMQNKS